MRWRGWRTGRIGTSLRTKLSSYLKCIKNKCNKNLCATAWNKSPTRHYPNSITKSFLVRWPNPPPSLLNWSQPSKSYKKSKPSPNRATITTPQTTRLASKLSKRSVRSTKTIRVSSNAFNKLSRNKDKESYRKSRWRRRYSKRLLNKESWSIIRRWWGGWK
jgi:hypothetical protein